MLRFEINGQTVDGGPDETVLDVARRYGIEIPTLCHHEALESFGACRMCLVEIWQPGWSLEEEGKLVTACLFPVRQGLVVRTGSPRVVASRTVVLQLLLARAPRSQDLRELAARYGVPASPFAPTERDDDCILCGLCTRMCEHLGHTAISTVFRGTLKEVATPLHKPSLACVGCGACARICPTQTISMQEDGRSRSIWGRTFELQPCERCGKRHLTKEQIVFFSAKSGLPQSEFRVCDECSRKETAARLAEHLL